MSVTLEDDGEEILGLLPNGKPDPAWAAALGMVSAGAGKRSLAFLIDAAVALVLTLPLTLGALPLLLGIVLVDPVPSVADIVTDSAFVPAVIFYAIGQGLIWIFVLVQVLVHGFRGVTVGKAIVGLRSVNVATFTKPGFWRILVRAVVFWTAFALIPVLGAVPFLASPLWDSQRRGRGWLDAIGRNWLLDVRRGLDPFDIKALRHAKKRALAPEIAAVAAIPSLATGTAGAVPSFVPAGRSSSGVISAKSSSADGPHAWSPPAVGAPTRAAPLERTPVAPASVTHAAPIVELGFDDGKRVIVSGSGLLGRNPEAGPHESFEHLLAIDDGSRQISKTHVAFGVDDAGFWLIDRGSVNGTMVTPPGGGPRELTPWQRETVEWGSVVEVGGRTFTVVSSAQAGSPHVSSAAINPAPKNPSPSNSAPTTGSA